MPQPTQRTTQTQTKRVQTSMPGMGFEPTIPVSERAKTVHALDCAAILIGPHYNPWIIKRVIDHWSDAIINGCRGLNKLSFILKIIIWHVTTVYSVYCIRSSDYGNYGEYYFEPWRWRQYVPLTRCHIPNGIILHYKFSLLTFAVLIYTINFNLTGIAPLKLP
jgi:hypothetical protein